MRKAIAAALVLAVTAIGVGVYANEMLDAEKRANSAVIEAAKKAEAEKKAAEAKAAEAKAAEDKTAAEKAKAELKEAEQKANATVQKVETNCPPDNPSNAQAAEKSIILPNAEGSEKSAAPTVQRDGKAVVVDPRCGPDPKQAN